MEKNKSITGEIIDYAKDFLKLEAAAGILLVFAAILAIIIANSNFAHLYNFFFNQLNFQIGFSSDGTSLKAVIDKPIVLWINDGLMAIFFFLVGLEIKRELMDGELASRERIILPMMGAIGGMVVPIAVFYFFNAGNTATIDGWAIPAATDIAFALGILALVGSRAPTALKVLLTAIAIVDDLGAIIIIALFYTDNLDIMPLIVASVCILFLIGLNVKKVTHVTPYILFGIIMWTAVLKSGVHATLAGVITALFIPMTCKIHEGHSPLRHLEHTLHPWVAFAVLPIFAFANSGIPLLNLGMEQVTNTLSLGIALGLFAGKQLGVFFFMAVALLLKLSPMPKDVTWTQLYGISILCGVGFTMSLFIGGLAFETQENMNDVRLGVLMGSAASAILGYFVLKVSVPKHVTSKEEGMHIS